jgi:hypothetical protein
VGVVVVPRQDEAPEPERPPEVFVASAAPGEVAGFSSTKIRGAAVHGGFYKLKNLYIYI